MGGPQNLQSVFQENLKKDTRASNAAAVEDFLQSQAQFVQDGTQGKLRLRWVPFVDPPGMTALSVRLCTTGEDWETTLFQVFVRAEGYEIRHGNEAVRAQELGDVRTWWEGQLRDANSYTMQMMRAMLRQ